jgi:hypothetical protein
MTPSEYPERAEADFSTPFQIGERSAILAARQTAKNACEKCGGAGWLWWHQLDDYSGPADETGRDDCRYSCDGKGCQIAAKIGDA